MLRVGARSRTATRRALGAQIIYLKLVRRATRSPHFAPSLSRRDLASSRDNAIILPFPSPPIHFLLRIQRELEITKEAKSRLTFDQEQIVQPSARRSSALLLLRATDAKPEE